MSGYVRKTKFEGEFDGEKVTCMLAPLSFADLLQMTGSDIKTDDEATQIMAKLLPNYVTELVGPKDAAGEQVPLNEVCSAAYFTGLVVDIGLRLAEAAKVTRPKKPSEPSAT
jgi:hypothetical protein